jgi:hypothetical protein
VLPPAVPVVSSPARKLLSHAIRGELEELAPLIRATGNEAYPHILTLFGFACAYICVDVGERLPTEADLRAVARRASGPACEVSLPVTEPEVYEFMSRVVLGGEFVDDVFAMERAAVVPLFTAANLLSMYCPAGKEWREYLDQIWDSFNAAGKLSAAVLPALAYLVHLSGGTRVQAGGPAAS